MMRRSGIPLRCANLLSLLVLGLLLALARHANAAIPPLDGFFPGGAARGTTNTITAIGKFDAWPPRVWIGGAGVKFAAETNKGRFLVTVVPDAEPGARLVRLYNEEGASDPKFFVVGASREVVEAEPNNQFAKAELMSNLPLTINGRLDKNGDVDSFAIDLRAGEWLDARVDSYTLMSKVDAVLRLVTTNGEQLAWNHDFITLDPRLVWQAAGNERVVLQIFGFAYPPASEIGFTGGEAVTYRLHVRVTNAAPTICGSILETNTGTADAAEAIQLPAVLRKVIGQGDEEHRFRFSASKNEFIEAVVDAASMGSPLDAWLKIEDSAGNQLARSDDADGSSDPHLEWKAPTNGIYGLALGSMTHRGGKDFCYQLNVRRAEPDFRATLAGNGLVLVSGTTNELKVDYKRLRGFTNEVLVSIPELPPGVSCAATNLPQKDGSVALRLVARKDSPPFQGPVRVMASEQMTKEQRPVPYELTTRGETGYAHLLIESDDHLWLTVRQTSAEKKKSGTK